MFVPHETWRSHTAMLNELAEALPAGEGRHVALMLVDAVRHAEISYDHIATELVSSQAENAYLRALLGEFVTGEEEAQSHEPQPLKGHGLHLDP